LRLRRDNGPDAARRKAVVAGQREGDGVSVGAEGELRRVVGVGEAQAHAARAGGGKAQRVAAGHVGHVAGGAGQHAHAGGGIARAVQHLQLEVAAGFANLHAPPKL
nr:hypothetical protein [Tanacetum cinerariifolium]